TIDERRSVFQTLNVALRACHLFSPPKEAKELILNISISLFGGLTMGEPGEQTDCIPRSRREHSDIA
ncbi:unnamed protein product, partial [Acanthoscelides obtectus]